jgi:hypothetical protein
MSIWGCGNAYEVIDSIKIRFAPLEGEIWTLEAAIEFITYQLVD